ncbi:MAG: hypothetical protein R3330_07770, partial [Saprospiraceae bacterium]|nr:hypothetical protein [Saprospiraceae bacterium]
MRTHFVLLLCCTVFCLQSSQAQYNCYNDTQPPIAICDAHTVVSLGADGKATLYASTLDDGSYDNC